MGSSSDDAARRATWVFLALLLGVNILHTMDRQVMAALLEPIKHDLKLTDGQLGFLSGLAYSGVIVLTGIPAGMLADRFSRKKIITGALAVWSILTALCGAATGYGALLLARMGVGAAESASPPACLSMIADRFPENRRASATGLFYAAGGIGTWTAFNAGTWIAEHYSWRLAFFLASAPALLLIPLLLIFLKEPPRGPAKATEKRGQFRPAVAAIFADKRLTWLIVGMALSQIAGVGLVGWAVSLLVRNYQMGLADAGFMVALATGFFMPLGQFMGGIVGDYVAARRPGAQMSLMGVAIMVSGALGVLCAYSPNTTVAVVALCVAGIGFMTYVAPAQGLLMYLSPSESRATIIGIVVVLGNLVGFGGGPYIVGRLSDYIGGPHSLSPAIAITMSAALLPGVIFMMLGRWVGQDARKV